MSKAQVEVVYDGEAVRAGSMDVHELAPALLSIGDLCQGANRTLNGDRAKLSVHVRSGFQRGSFEIRLEVIQDIAGQAKTFLLGDNVLAARTLLELLFGGVGVFRLIKWLKGRKPTTTTTLESGNVRIELENAHIEVKPEVSRLYQEGTIRKAALGAVRPLGKEGMETFEVREEKTILESVNKSELPYFADIEPENTLVGEERLGLFEIVKLSFDEKHKWTLSDGSNNFNADIEDEDFFGRVQAREISFAKGDILRVRIQTHTILADGKLKTTHKILRVLEVIPGARQSRLPLSE